VLVFSINNPYVDWRKKKALSLGAQTYCFTSAALVRTIERILSPGRETG
jgi:hypothetical protein